MRVGDNPVLLPRQCRRHVFIANVAEHARRIPFERITPAARTGHLVAEYIAALDGKYHLARNLSFSIAVRVEYVASDAPRTASVKAEGPKQTAVVANLDRAFLLAHHVIAPKRCAAAELAGTHGVREKLIGSNLQRLLDLGNLDGGRGDIRAQIGIALGSVRPGAAAPSTGEEIDINERLAVGAIAPEGDAHIAAVGGGKHAIRRHLGKRAETAIDLAKPGQTASGGGRGRNGMADRARRREHLNDAKKPFVRRNVPREDGFDGDVDRGIGKGLSTIEGALDLRRAPCPVGNDMVGFLSKRDFEPDGLVQVYAIVIEPILKIVGSVWKLAYGRAGQPFGIVDDLLQVCLGLGEPICLDEVEQTSLAGVAACKLCPQIALQ